MTDMRVTKIARAVNEHLDSVSVDQRAFDVGNPDHFECLVRRVSPLFSDCDSTEIEAVVALCLLGPGSAADGGGCAFPSWRGVPDVPPAAIREEFWSLVRQYQGARGGTVMQLAVAYGCGKWRVVRAGVESWQGRWAGAVTALARAMVPGARDALRWLAKWVVGLRQAVEVRSPGDTATHHAWRHAHLVALKLCWPVLPLLLDEEGLRIHCDADGARIIGTLNRGEAYEIALPPGTKYVVNPDGEAVLLGPKRSIRLAEGSRVVVTVGDERTVVSAPELSLQVKLSVGQGADLIGCDRWQVWECCCGHRYCAQRHRLSGWNPSAGVELWSFAASALKGPLPGLCVNSYIQGMSFPVFAQRGFC